MPRSRPGGIGSVSDPEDTRATPLAAKVLGSFAPDVAATLRTMDSMAWFLRAIEQPDGRWACRWGRTEYDAHPDLPAAVQHLRALAASGHPGEVLRSSFIGWTA